MHELHLLQLLLIDAVDTKLVINMCCVQIQLSASLLTHYLHTATMLYSDVVQMMDLYWPKPSPPLSSPTSKSAVAVTSDPVPLAQSFAQLNGSSSFAESPNAAAVPATMTSESVSLEVLSMEGWHGAGTDSGGTELSLWLQWTLLKFVVSMYGRSHVNKG